MFGPKRISSKSLLLDIARGARPRIIDFRGDYTVAIPGTIPVQFDPDIFFEEEMWVQDMLGVPFSPHQNVILVCEFGNSADTAQDLFREKNPRTAYRLVSLKGGMLAYREYIKALTVGYRRQDGFLRELTDLATPQHRFQKLAGGLMERRTFFQKLFG
ncbi:MAG: hypothetical protein HQL50_04875 [Magnetococcales bacterium]|nr:hypothetical protein [Magnetococcales bacterium]